MMDLYQLGVDAVNLFWGPVLVWSACAFVCMAVIRLIPARYPQLHMDGAVGLLLALPLALGAAILIPESTATFLPVLDIIPATSASSGSGGEAAVLQQAAAFSMPWLEIMGALTLIAALASAMALLRLGHAWYRLHRLIARSAPIARGSRDVRISADISVAFSAGLVRPVIVLPAGISREDRETIIRHEEAHLAHGDLWRTWVASLVKAMFVFHPLVHLLDRQFQLQSEICCDHRVIQQTPRSASAYASLLLRQVPPPRRLAPALPLVSTPSQLKKRIQAMKNPTVNLLSRTRLMAWMVGITLSIGLLAGCSDMQVGPTEADIPDVTNEAYDLVMDLPAYKGNGTDEVFVIVEEAPILLGGLAELQRRIKYPERAEQAGVQGRVFLQFIVDQEGNVRDPQVTRGIGAGADEEALRVLQTMKFVPGVQRGQRVRVKMSLPVTFRLDDDHPNASPMPPPPPVVSKEQIDAVEVYESISDVPFDWILVASTKQHPDRNMPIESFRGMAAINGGTAIVKGGSGFENVQDERLRELLSDPTSIAIIKSR